MCEHTHDCECIDLETVEQLIDERVEERVEERVDDVEERLRARYDSATTFNSERIAELQARELEKGAHLKAENVDEYELEITEGELEIFQKDDGQYSRVPESDDPLRRGGDITHAVADLLPIQRLSRCDDEMLHSVARKKPDRLAAQAWREKDDPGRYNLWSKGSSGVRVYLDASDLAEWIRTREAGISKKYSQELARRTFESMKDLASGRLGEKKKKRRKDGLNYSERRLILFDDVDLPGEHPDADETNPTTDTAVGE